MGERRYLVERSVSMGGLEVTIFAFIFWNRSISFGESHYGCFFIGEDIAPDLLPEFERETLDTYELRGLSLELELERVVGMLHW